MRVDEVKKKILGKIVKAVSPYTRKIGAYCDGKNSPNTRIISDSGAHIFCGYYDISPFDKDDKRILVLRAEQDHTSPHDTNQVVEIGYYDLKDGKNTFEKIAETRSWNWQQGARLQWLPDHDNKIIYNDFRNNMFVSVIRDLSTNKEQEIEKPVYAVHPDGKHFLSLDFTRLHLFRRGYGYHQLSVRGKGDLSPPDDGIWNVDIPSGKSDLLISLDKISSFSPRESMRGAYHYVNHLQWSPDGTKIIFFHLWANGGKSKNSRLLLLEENGNLVLLDEKIRPSHTAWISKDKLLVTGMRKENDEMYHLYDLSAKEGKYYERSVSGMNDDGHPSFLDQTEFISDTYPDIWGKQHLFLGNLNGERKSIVSFYLPNEFSGELRCDLHPRLSRSKEIIACDIVKDGKRAVAFVPIETNNRNIP